MIAPVQSVPKNPLVHVFRNPTERLRVCLSSVSSGHIKSDFPPVVLHRKLSLEVTHPACL